MSTPRSDITELELLALVEGDTRLPRERREALLADAAVARLVAKLGADRAALVVLPRAESAPAGLVAAAIERAEREALAALAAAEPMAAGPIRTSSVIEGRPSVLARLVQTPWPRRFAAAAGLALAAAGVYFAAAALIDWNATQPPRRIATLPSIPSPPPDPDAQRLPTPSPIEIALAPTDATTTVVPALTIPNGPIDTATAVALVPQGRVVLILHAADPQKALVGVGVVAQRRGGASLWQPLAADTPEFGAALAAARAATQSGGFDTATLKTASVALVGLGVSTESFESLMAALRTDSGIGSPEFSPQWAAVDAAALKVAHDRASLLALQPHRVLWWEQGSSAWTPPAVVPVVILSP